MKETESKHVLQVNLLSTLLMEDMPSRSSDSRYHIGLNSHANLCAHSVYQ